MEIIPAIDLKDGKCVRLRQGQEDSGTVYAGDPVAVAARWLFEGARRLHVVNLDGAFGRKSKNIEILKSISSLGSADVQFGGGLRSREEIAEALDAGASSVVLGTIAFEDPDLLTEALRVHGPERVIVAIDALDGNVATRGWKVLTGRNVHHAARDLKRVGVRKILFTDIARDGMMLGPDIDTLRSLGESGLSVIASGGISSLDDVRALTGPAFRHVAGAIIGKALYEGRIVLGAAIDIAEGRAGPASAHSAPSQKGKK